MGLFVNGCASTETKVNKNKLNIGINKEDFCFVQVTMCIQTMGEAWNNKIRGIYYPDTKKEIAYDKNEKTFRDLDYRIL